MSHSPGSERNNLKGVYILRVNTLNLMLRDSRTDKTLLIWPYRYIRRSVHRVILSDLCFAGRFVWPAQFGRFALTFKRIQTASIFCSDRYGRSKTSFTFEAGRKCTSGEGYFKFKVKDGDAVFNSVQKRTKEMKKHAKGSPTASGASAPPEYVTPILPARQYSPEAEAASGQSIHSRVKMFDKPDVKQKPPMLQKLKPNSKSKPETPSVFVSQARPDVHHSPEAGRTRITQGYELARTVYPPGYSDQAAMPYAEYNYGKTLDVSYKESTEHVSNGGADQSPPNNAQNRVLGNGQQTPGSPVYAVYDLARSSRMHVYDTPSGPEDPYYGGASADSTTTTSSSFVYAEPYSTTPVGDAWRRQGRTRDNVHIEHYDPEAGGVEADGIYEEPGDGSQVPKISAISDRLKQQRLETDDSDVAYDRIDVHKPPANPGQAGSGGRAAGRPGVGAPVAPGRSPRAPLPDIPNESEYGQLSVQPQNKAKAFLSNIRNPFKSS